MNRETGNRKSRKVASFGIEFRKSVLFFFFAFTNFVDKIAPKVAKVVEFDRFPYLSHRVKKEREIVMRNQSRRQHLAGLI